jgi:aspartate/methionine/tyrosine aminotransferase
LPIPIAQRVSTLRPTAVNTVLAEVKALAEPPISLMRGEPDLRTPPHIVAAAERALAQGRTSYPDNRGEPRLREAVAAKLQRENGLTYHPADEILVVPGATFGIYAALAAMLNPGDAVLLPDPIYDAYHSPVRLAGAEPISAQSRIENGRFILDLEAMERAVTPQCKALLLNTPWNPTGTVLTAAELRDVADFCQRHNLILIADEIYEAIVYEGHTHLSPARIADRDRVVTINALSKTYAMTGWRVGYCTAPAEFIRAMFLVLQQSSRGPATFVQDAAAEALAGPQECVAEMRSIYSERREQVITALDGVAGCRVLAPEGGFFAMLDVRALGRPSNDIRRELLVRHGVVVIHGAAYGPGGEGTLRVSFASGGANLHLGLERLRRGLESMQ